MPRPLCDSQFLYGLHDTGGEHIMVGAGVPSWALITVALGTNPNDHGSGDDFQFRGNYKLSDQGLGVIVRLNAGYNPVGTMGREQEYDAFAQRCANFVRRSQGVHIWIVGNGPNHPIEWAGSDWDWNARPPRPKSPTTVGEKITPEQYACCYRKARAAIHSLPGPERDQVLIASVAPWNSLFTYPDNPDGDWILYFRHVLDALGPDGLDGITLHAYIHGADPNLIRSEATMTPPFQHRHWHFRVYRESMDAIPESMRHLPAYITETDQGDGPWVDHNSGWVQAAYHEIDAWNRSHAQKIRALILYRWQAYDHWYIRGKSRVMEDFRQALAQRYTREVEPVQPEDEWAEVRVQVERVEQELAQMQGDIRRLADLLTQVATLKETVTALADHLGQITALQEQVATLTTEVNRLMEDLARAAEEIPPVVLPQPAMQDVRGQLTTHPERRYPTRSRDTIRRVVVHHTVTPGDIDLEIIARFQVNQGRAGITYHFLVPDDGTIYWTQPLEVVTTQTL